jgi:hypothetical protein
MVVNIVDGILRTRQTAFIVALHTEMEVTSW